MKRTLLIVLAVFFFANVAKSQVSFEWAQAWGRASQDDEGRAITVDASGNVYVAGYFSSSVDFDPGGGVVTLTAAGGFDAFVAKFNSAGVLQWAINMGGTGNDQANAIGLDPSGNVFITGTYTGTADFDPSAGGVFNIASGDAANPSPFVCKLAPDGTFVWARSPGAGANATANALAVDGAGNVYTTGKFLGTGDFDTDSPTLNFTGPGVFISKLNADGSYGFSKKIGGGSTFDSGNAIAVDQGGNVYVTGQFIGTSNFSTSSTFNLTSLSTVEDIFITKINSNGDFLFAKQMGGTLYDVANSMVIDATGSIYISGLFESTPGDFDPSPTSTFNLSASGGTDNPFVVKMNSNGSLIWAKDLATGTARNLGIAVDGSGVYSAGTFTGTADFDPGSATFNLNALGQDFYIDKMDLNGNFLWALKLGGPGVDQIQGIALGGGQIYTSGFFQSSPMDFDPTPGTASKSAQLSKDIFVLDLLNNGPPVITNFTPTTGPVGTSVTITGTDFGLLDVYDQVKFNGTLATITAATPTSITATVATGSTTGPISVTVGGQTGTSSMDFTVPVPTITSFTPTSGQPGTQVTITGTNFAVPPSGNTVKFNGTTAVVVITSSNSTSILTTVPVGATSGQITVTVGGTTATSTDSFTVLGPPPTVTSFNPGSGPVGAPVTITGTDFDATPANNTVKFNGTTAVVTASTATSITTTVPTGATTGQLSVTVSGQTGTSTSNFVVTAPVPPTVTSFNPTSGPEGTPVTITGTNFSATPANNTVKFNGTTAVVTASTATSITTTVPTSATTGLVSVTVSGQTGTSTSNFVVTAPLPPTVTSFNPTSGPIGTSVTITGTNFSATPANNTVTFNGTTAVVTASTTTSITTSVPTGTTTGLVSVTVSGQTGTSTSNFVVTAPVPPTVTSFNPTSGPIGTPVTITGTNFSATPANNTVTFNGTTAVVTASTTTSITTTVPAGASTGLISVTVTGLTGTSTSNFVVTTSTIPPTITSFNPTSGSVGTPVTITGTNFSATPTNNTVTFNGTTAVVTASTTTTISVTVPTGATTGLISVTVAGQTAPGTTFTVTTGGVDTTPPLVTGNTTQAVVDNGQAVPVSVSLADAESGVASATLMYRYISSDLAFTSLPMNLTSGQNYTQTIPVSTSNELGVEYMFDVTNGAGLKIPASLYRVRVTIPGAGLAIPYESAGSDVSNYRIVAVPLDLPANTLGNVFNELGSTDNTRWRMWHYANGQNSELDLSSTIVPGNGYWLISRTSPGNLFSGSGETVAASLDAPFTIDLKAGWNQIGNPYNFVLNWADVQSANVGLPGLRKFVDTFVDATVLDKMEGGFVFVNADRTIAIPVIKDKTLNGGRIAAETKVNENPLDENNWQVRLHLTHGIMKNEIGGFGMNEAASENFDVYDGVTTPRFFGKWLEINHAQPGRMPVLSKDIIPTTENHVWKFEIESSEADPTMTLTWDNSYFGNGGQQLYLWDNALQRRINMRTTNSYTFDANTSGSFKVIFGSASFVMPLLQAQNFMLSVWPNAAAKSDNVTISVAVPDSGTELPVSIEVIDALGQKIWTFESSLSPGNHDVTWKLNGSEAAGIYIVKARRGISTDVSRVVLKGN